MEILRQNPVNLYSFVGLITVPIRKKQVIRNSINTTMFSAKNEQKKQTLTIWLMSTVMKYLQSALLRYFRRLHEASSLTLLSQLVNAVSFGGLSNLTSKNLQNAMEVE
jgi:hypothetical protein